MDKPRFFNTLLNSKGQNRKIFFTGIQATGTLTLGNYCGLIHHILKIQNDYEVIYHKNFIYG